MDVPRINRGDELSGRVAVITGAATGIGQAIAETFVQLGAAVALIDLSRSIVDVAAGFGEAHFGCVADISDYRAVQEASEDVSNRLGHVDIVVNNAGIGPLEPAESFSVETWDKTMAVNLRGPFLVARAFAGGMIRRGWGRVINLASQASVIGIEGHLAYCASKAGVVGMTKCMALEWGPKGITVNAISPTVVETQLGLSGWAGEKGTKARATIPTRRFAKPWEIAAFAAYLASDAAAMINGANLLIDGGYTVV